jgi:DNA modification methylase
MKGLEKFINQVIHGDALEVLKEIPDNSIDLGIASSQIQGLQGCYARGGISKLAGGGFKRTLQGNKRGGLLFLQSQSALRRRENDPSLTVAN